MAEAGKALQVSYSHSGMAACGPGLALGITDRG